MSKNSLKKHHYPWKIFTGMLLLAILGFTGCGHAPPEQIPSVSEVAVVAIQPQKILLTTNLPGRTAAYRVAEIRPQVSGLLQKRLFVEGSQVKEGEVLYEVDDASYRAVYNNAAADLLSAKESTKKAQATLDSSIAALQRHEAVLKLAKINRDRYKRLYVKKAISAMEYDQAIADVDVANAALRVAQAQIESDRQSVEMAKATIQKAEASLETAKINLDYTKIISPISGRIGRSNVTDGALVTAYQAQTMATVQQIDPLYVDVPQSTVKLLLLKRNLDKDHLEVRGSDEVKLMLEDGTVYPLPGKLQFADVSVDQTTGSVILRIVVPNPDGLLLPGMFVHAVIEEGIRERALLVPQQAVSRDPKGNPFTFVVDDSGKVQQRGLTIERSIDNKWLISSGINAGDRVIVEGTQKVRPGMEVKMVPLKSDDSLATSPPKTSQKVLH